MAELRIAPAFVFEPFYQTEWRTIGTAQFFRKKICVLWLNFYPTGFLSLCLGHVDLHPVYCLLYGGAGQIMVWLGLSANYIYGDGIQAH